MVATKFYTVKEVISTLGISRKTLFNWEKEGKIPPARRDKISNYRIFTEHDIEQLQALSGRVKDNVKTVPGVKV